LIVVPIFKAEPHYLILQLILYLPVPIQLSSLYQLEYEVDEEFSLSTLKYYQSIFFQVLLNHQTFLLDL